MTAGSFAKRLCKGKWRGIAGEENAEAIQAKMGVHGKEVLEWARVIHRAGLRVTHAQSVGLDESPLPPFVLRINYRNHPLLVELMGQSWYPHAQATPDGPYQHARPPAVTGDFIRKSGNKGFLDASGAPLKKSVLGSLNLPPVIHLVVKGIQGPNQAGV